MTSILFFGTGVLLAILWIDIKFDWLAVPYRKKPGILPEDVLLPMTYYYRYVTGKPIVIALIMLSMIVAIILEIVQASVPAWAAWASLIVFGTAMTRSAVLVIPTCRRFGQRTDTPEKETATAHAILWMHFFAFGCILVLIALQLYATMKPQMILFVCIGFVAGVAWVNVKFDLLAVPYRGKSEKLPEEVLEPIALFHRYIRSAAQLGIALIVILAILILQIVQNTTPTWLAWTCLIVLLSGIAWLASIGIRSARRLGTRLDSLETQTKLAHGLLPLHIFALSAILIVMALQTYAVLANSI